MNRQADPWRRRWDVAVPLCRGARSSSPADELGPFDIRSPGSWLQAIAVTHAGVGLLTYRRALMEIAEDRTSIPDHGDKATAFWFMAAAPALWLGGRLLRSAESANDLAAQRSAGLALTGLGLTGGVAMPASGFWGVVAVGLASVRRSVSASS